MIVPIELKIKYLIRRLQDLSKLKQSLEGEDYSFAQLVGHQVKGNAVTFEVPQIAHFGLEIERAAIKCDKEKLRILIDKMESLLVREKSLYFENNCSSLPQEFEKSL